jgi:two-component system, cell cycle sensor histidine kinase and response regulator CckA
VGLFGRLGTTQEFNALKARKVVKVKAVGPMQTILLVENDPAKLVARSLILRCFGYTVLEAGSRGEAWRVCHNHSGPIHLILTNAIPGSSSQFVARLQLLYPQIRALFVSDASSAELAVQQIMRGEYAFLQEPFRADVLADTIRGLLDRPRETRAASFS